jgi:hypothetical protein
MEAISDRERKRRLAELVERYHRLEVYQRDMNLQWNDWANEIGLSSPTVMSQYRSASRTPEGTNLIKLASYFMKHYKVNLFDELGYATGGDR